MARQDPPPYFTVAGGEGEWEVWVSVAASLPGAGGAGMTATYTRSMCGQPFTDY